MSAAPRLVEGLVVVAEQLELLFDAPSEAPGRPAVTHGRGGPAFNLAALCPVMSGYRANTTALPNLGVATRTAAGE